MTKPNNIHQNIIDIKKELELMEKELDKNLTGTVYTKLARRTVLDTGIRIHKLLKNTNDT